MASRLGGISFQNPPCKERRGRRPVFHQGGSNYGSQGQITTPSHEVHLGCSNLSLTVVSHKLKGTYLAEDPLMPAEGASYCRDRFQGLENCSRHDGQNFYVLSSGTFHFFVWIFPIALAIIWVLDVPEGPNVKGLGVTSCSSLGGRT